MVEWLQHPYLTYYSFEAYQEGLRAQEFILGCEAWSRAWI